MYYDEAETDRRLRAEQRRMEKAERRELAKAATLKEHPVMQFVRSLPVEETDQFRGNSIFAISSVYLDGNIQKTGMANSQKTMIAEGQKDVPVNGQKTGSDEGQKDTPINGQKVDIADSQKVDTEDGQKDATTDGQRVDSKVQNTDTTDGQKVKRSNDLKTDRSCGQIFLLPTYNPGEHIYWMLPAHDFERPKQRGCGFIPASYGNGGIKYVACPMDFEHYIRGKASHCWSLACEKCACQTALGNGAKIEQRVMTYQKLIEKKTGRHMDLKHWVFSPDPVWVAQRVQIWNDYDELCDFVEDLFMHLGATAGVIVFHPWRQKEDRWEFSPHFHVVCFGYVKQRKWVEQHPGFVIKQVHSKEKIRSPRQLFGYLETHMGLPVVERNPDEIDYEQRFLDYMWPENYTNEDYDKETKGVGRRCGDFSDMGFEDWLEWTMRPLKREVHLRYFGGLSNGKIRKCGQLRQYMQRTCPECREPLRCYDGDSDTVGEPVRYIRDVQVNTLGKTDAAQFARLMQTYGKELKESGGTIVDAAKLVPYACSTLEIDVQRPDDILLSGPFDRADLVARRQTQAYHSPEELSRISKGVETE